MTNHSTSFSEHHHPRDEDSSSESVTPPPPPEKGQDDDVGLATEMVFSGHQREQLRNAPDYETFETGVLSFDDEELYQDVDPPEDAKDRAHTELNITSDHSDTRNAARSAHFQSASARFEPGASTQDDFGNYHAQSFDPKQQHSKQPGTTNEPFALAMFIILTLVGLGILGTLLWLVYRLITGA